MSSHLHRPCSTDIEFTKVCLTESEKEAVFRNLDSADYDLILSPTGWLDCAIIQQAQVLLKEVNPLIEGFQRTTLGPVRNFNVMSGEFIQILHTGAQHWVCISTIGCSPGYVNLYESMFHEVIGVEVEEQVTSLLHDSYLGLNNVSVQQQQNGSDCGIFAISFATCLVYFESPENVTFDIPKMRKHLAQCLRNRKMELFPTV